MTAVSTACYLHRHRFPVVGRSAGSDRQSLRRYHRPNRWRRGRGLSGSTCRQAGVRRLPPFGGVATAYPCQTTHAMTLPATLSGFRLAHPAGPMRLLSEPLGPRGPGADRVDAIAVSAFRIVKDRYERRSGAQGVSLPPERKNPGSAPCGHQPGFSCDPREVPGCSGNLPEMSCGGYVIPFLFPLMGR